MKRVKHYPNGNIKRIEVRNDRGNRHNESGPAIQAWHPNGQERLRVYCLNGNRHNESGPAIQSWHPNGHIFSIEYYLDDILHNDNGPALQQWDENGQRKHKEYYFNGKKVNKEEFQYKVKANWDVISFYQKFSEELIKGIYSRKECEEYWNIEKLHELTNVVEVCANGKTVRISK